MTGLVIILCISAGLSIGFVSYLAYLTRQATAETLRRLQSPNFDESLSPPGP